VSDTLLFCYFVSKNAVYEKEDPSLREFLFIVLLLRAPQIIRMW